MSCPQNGDVTLPALSGQGNVLGSLSGGLVQVPRASRSREALELQPEVDDDDDQSDAEVWSDEDESDWSENDDQDPPVVLN